MFFDKKSQYTKCSSPSGTVLAYVSVVHSPKGGTMDSISLEDYLQQLSDLITPWLIAERSARAKGPHVIRVTYQPPGKAYRILVLEVLETPDPTRVPGVLEAIRAALAGHPLEGMHIRVRCFSKHCARPVPIDLWRKLSLHNKTGNKRGYMANIDLQNYLYHREHGLRRRLEDCFAQEHLSKSKIPVVIRITGKCPGRRSRSYFHQMLDSCDPGQVFGLVLRIETSILMQHKEGVAGMTLRTMVYRKGYSASPEIRFSRVLADHKPAPKPILPVYETTRPVQPQAFILGFFIRFAPA